MTTEDEYLFKHEFCSDDLKCIFEHGLNRYGDKYTDLIAVYLGETDIQGLLSEEVIKRICQAYEDYNYNLMDFYA